MRIALVHDWLNNLGGADRVLIELHKIFPEAPIYVLFSRPEFILEHLPEATVRNSWLQKLPGILKFTAMYSIFMPSAIESFDFSEFDVVISSSVIFSKGIIVKPHTRHICYCYSPTRFLWDRSSEYERGGIFSNLARHALRFWDRGAADRVDEFVAISEHVAKRIKKYYRRDAKIIHPPVKQFSVSGSDSLGGYFLIVSRLVPHKNIEIAITAFNKLKDKLIIVGDGPLKAKLKKIAKPNIQFTGYINDNKISKYYANCRAVILPNEEDFGLTPVEAMSFGKPTLALRRGGALETIKEGINGIFFNEAIPESLANGIRKINNQKFNPELIKKSASKFDVTNFKKQITSLVK